MTVDILDALQVSNPKGCSMPHDWIASRYWACTVGYGERGSWDCPRRALTVIAENWIDYDSEVRPLYEKHGFLDGRIIKAEIVTSP